MDDLFAPCRCRDVIKNVCSLLYPILDLEHSNEFAEHLSRVQFIAQVATENWRKIAITTPWTCHLGMPEDCLVSLMPRLSRGARAIGQTLALSTNFCYTFL